MGNSFCSIFKNYLFYIILTSLIILSVLVGINIGISFLYFFLIEKFLPDYFYRIIYFLGEISFIVYSFGNILSSVLVYIENVKILLAI